MKKNENSLMSPKHVGKMMRLAKTVAEDNNPCYSRKVGCIITDQDGVILGTGYNGPPRKTPHCDSKEYIQDILWPKLTFSEQADLVDYTMRVAKISKTRWDKLNTAHTECDIVASNLDGCKTCPRRLLNFGPGVRPDLCSCQHGERNAISNSSVSVAGGILFGWCCISCFSCTGAIINARIKEVHFLEGPEYESGCLKLYEYANIPVFLHSAEEILR